MQRRQRLYLCAAGGAMTGMLSGCVTTGAAQIPPASTATPPLPTATATPTAPKRAPVHGKLVDTNGKSVAGVTLYLGMWQSYWPDTAEIVVTTGPDGTFTWNHTGFPYAESAVAPEVFALPAQAPWQLVTGLSFQTGGNQASYTRTIVGQLLQKAKAHWINNRGYVNGQATPNTGTLIVEMPTQGTVTMSPRGANGERYPNQAVQLWPASQWISDNEMYRWDGRTDARGDIVLPQFPQGKNAGQPMSFRVVLPGIGYGTSAPFTVRAGQTVQASLAPLAPFVAVSGTVAPELRKPGQVVRLARVPERENDPVWAVRQAPVDAQGRWTLPDVTSGLHRVYLFDTAVEANQWDGNRTYKATQSFTVTGKRTPQALVLVPRAPVPTNPVQAAVIRGDETGAIEGVVRDADGKPVAGADVWAVGTSSGIRLYTHTLHTTTGPDGTYRITGMPRVALGGGGFGASSTLTLYAAQKGRVPALRTIQELTGATEVHAPDLLFPRAGKSLDITVLDANGKPAAGVTVEARATLYAAGASPVFVGNRNSIEASSLQAALVPRVQTDTQGNAHFTQLRPARYTIAAARVSEKTPPEGTRANGETSPLGIVQFGRFSRIPDDTLVAVGENIPVSVEGTSRYTLRLAPRSKAVTLRFQLPDGAILREEALGYAAEPASAEIPTQNRATRGGSEAVDHMDADLTPGLWHIATYLSAEPPYRPTNDQPFLTGQTTIAVRSGQKRAQPVDIRLTRRNATNVNIRIVDENGKPVQGTVYKSNFDPFPRQGPEAAGASDRNGRLTLPNVPGATLTLRAEADGDDPLPELRDNDALPPDAALMNRRRWPALMVPVTPGAAVTLKASPVGWVRGHVAGSPEGYIYPLFDLQRTWNTRARYDSRTGEYIVGPFPPGPVTFNFDGKAGGKQVTVQVKPGIVRQDFALDPALARKDWDAERQRIEQTPVTVVDATGKPIAGALVAYFNGQTMGNAARLTNEAGQAVPAPVQALIEAGVTRYPMSGQNFPPPPTTPRWVAWLPGSYGAGITVFPKTAATNGVVRITLPPAIMLRGTVTVGGKPLPQTAGAVTVYARHVGSGALDDYVSVSVQPSADGSFELRGLTPGRYQVQAMLDATYVSQAQSVTVAAAGRPGLPALNIGAPGTATMLELGASNALAHVVPVVKLAGPLGQKIAPRFYAADGKGIVRLEGLSAGKHRLRLPGGAIREITIAPEK